MDPTLESVLTGASIKPIASGFTTVSILFGKSKYPSIAILGIDSIGDLLTLVGSITNVAATVIQCHRFSGFEIH